MKTVYFDSAATTQVREEVINDMQEVLASHYGNPSSTHAFGRSSKSIIESTIIIMILFMKRQISLQKSSIKTSQ